ncbi:neuronal acetylcholine receptor subunit alpha-3-like [Ylistrum balloti]|uniref:neuronal acetylcholine receptor subunit alpha-3-like n=1 Tax=Ylistrum balloti TaxID=509963 RepID=UPI0029059D05|nr:neuronal acetylcholine receptor subunit alpha-3-like [Ylistrum balloti]
MRKRLLVLLLIVVSSLPCPVTSTTHDNVKALLTNIFTTNSYNKMVRPSANQATATRLYVDIDLFGITEIDEVQEKMSTTAALFIMWHDDYMKWNPSDYNGTDVIYVPQKDIWKPDIALKNGFTKMKELGDDFILTIISSDGMVIWQPLEVFQTKCSIDIQYFPFDKQRCDLEFGVWSSPVSSIAVGLGSSGVMLTDYQANEEWDLITTSFRSMTSNQDGAVVIFSLIVARKPGYIVNNVVLPVMLLSVLSVFVFVLPVDSGEKMGYVMTVYLAFAVFLTIVSASLPVSSTMSLLGMYLTLQLSLGTAIVIITALELRIHYRNSSREIPRFVKRMVRLSKTLRCSKSNRINDDVRKSKADVMMQEEDILTEVSAKTSSVETVIEPKVTEELTWQDVTSAIDFFCFWIFFFLNLILTIALFVEGYINSSV